MVAELLERVSREQRNPEAWRRLGEALARRGRAEEALLALNNAIALGDRHARRSKRGVQRELDRMVRQMAATVDATLDPWSLVERFGPGGPDGLRSFFVKRFAWAAPSRDAVVQITAFADGDPMLEVGAGLGLWARLLQDAGAAIVATDDLSTHHRTSVPGAEPWTRVERMGGLEALARHDAKVLFLCWPPSDGALVQQMAEHFTGDRLVLVGEEGSRAITGTAALEDWVETQRVEIPQWPGFADGMVFHRRR